MVTYNLRRVCGGRTTTIVPQTVRRPYGFYASRTATSRFLTRRKVIASLAVFFNFTWNFFSETAMPQRRNHTARSPYGRLALAVRRYMVLNLSWVPRKSYGGLTASLRRPHGALTVAVRQTCSSCNNREVTSGSPYGHLMVFDCMNRTIAVRSPQHLWPQLPSPARPYDFKKLRFTHRRPENCTVTAWYVTEA